MIRLDPDRLREVRTLEDVLGYLADDLDWPIDVDDLEDATFEWEPDELGIPADRVPTLESLRQLRPLQTDQPWGVFFLEFAGPRLPLTALRRLLTKLVTKKRATSGTLKTWALDDLLFVITTSTGESVELHFVAFLEQADKPAEIRSIPWRPRQSPARHLKRVAGELLPHLAWPDSPSSAEDWRSEWQRAFMLRHGEAIASAVRLADRMADTARLLRQEIAAAIEAEKTNGPFRTLMAEVKENLVGSVTPAAFADMCAQTLVYGVLTSRVTDPESFGASPTLAVVPLSNPFLAAFFDQVHHNASVLDLEGIGLEQLIADLRETNVEAILDQFGASARGGDPVIHFYEEFLQRYDPKMRADAGAFYTPQRVVEFMTRTVDSLLRERFGLAQGSADGSTWADVARRNDFDLPSDIDPSAPFVSMIDPATGTGTFIVEWLRRTHASFLTSHDSKEWPDHAKDVVLPSIHAFELMLGPYAIAHLKVALELHDLGVTDAAPTILLTDTLDHGSHGQLSIEDDPVSSEGERAAELKNTARFTVVIANPPYDREQKEVGASGKRKGGVARYGVPGILPLMNKVLEPLTAAGLGKHAKNAYNDYVYFWTWAAWQAVTKVEGPGIVALITASSYLEGVSLGGLRSHLRDVFDELWIVDLGGEGRGARVDENVFAIRTPVAIAFGVRTGREQSSCKVRYLKVAGTAEEKLATLADTELLSTPTTAVEGVRLERFTPRSQAVYNSWTELTDLFPVIFPGVKAGRTWVIGPSESVLRRRVDELLAQAASDRAQLFKNSPTGRKSDDSIGRTNMPGTWDRTPVSRMAKHPPVGRYGYRSLDRQWVIADPRFLDRASAAWGVRSAEQLYFTTLTSTKLGKGPVVMATPYVPDLDHFRGSYGAKNAIPLYRDAKGSRANVADGLLQELTERLGFEVHAEQLFAYVYGLTGTSAFADRFADELGEAAGPVRIPITTDADLFQEVVALGEELMWLHCWGERFHDGRDFPDGNAKELVAVTGAYPEKFRWDSADGVLHVGGGSFGPVSKSVWEFEVSGLNVLRSWLGNRMKGGKGKKSSLLDEIGANRWVFTPELLRLLAILEQTVERTPQAAVLIGRVTESDLVDPATLPCPTEAERKLPKS